MGLLRDVIIADSDAEAVALWKDAGVFSGRAWFEPFGFRKGVIDPVTGVAPNAEESVANAYARGLREAGLPELQARQHLAPAVALAVPCEMYYSRVIGSPELA